MGTLCYLPPVPQVGQWQGKVLHRACRQFMGAQHVEHVFLVSYCCAAELPTAGRCAEAAAAAAVTARPHSTAAAAAAAAAALPLGPTGSNHATDSTGESSRGGPFKSPCSNTVSINPLRNLEIEPASKPEPTALGLTFQLKDASTAASNWRDTPTSTHRVQETGTRLPASKLSTARQWWRGPCQLFHVQRLRRSFCVVHVYDVSYCPCCWRELNVCIIFLDSDLLVFLLSRGGGGGGLQPASCSAHGR
jgi:hypothetical protein